MNPSSLKFAKKFQEDLTNLVLNIEKNTKPNAISKRRHAIQLPQQFQMMPATLKMKNIVLERFRWVVQVVESVLWLKKNANDI